MNLSITVPLLLSIGSAYFLLQDEDIKTSTRFLAKRKAKATSLFPKIRDHDSVQHRLLELGKNRSEDLNQFRFTQIATILGSTFTAYILLTLTGKSPFLSLLLAFFVGISGYVFSDRALTKRIEKKRTLLESEFPAIVEMLTLCMAAGETPLGAMSRVSQRSSGLLSTEFSLVIESVTSGIPFQFALDEMGRRVKSTHIRRFVDALITAMLRGAPLVDVLQSHARNAREAERNRVLSAAGKSEVSMMIPVVFLILPISILFALWPSLSNLNLFLA
ncbi:TadB Flp pilus assembly protein TadB [Candidatus Nanopelagicaceae bacterium]|jgi:tight adherence protein C